MKKILITLFLIMPFILQAQSSNVRFVVNGNNLLSYRGQTPVNPNGWYNIVNYGADPTGVIDATTAIRNACTAAYNAGGKVVGAGTFLISDSIVIRSDADFTSAIFNINDDTKTAVVYYGHELYSHIVIFPRVIQLHSRTAGTWPGTDVGIKIIDANECEFYIPWITQFKRGLVITTEGSHGTVYSTFHLGLIAGCKICLNLIPRTSGWVNDNLFINGNLACYSGDGAGVADTRAILISPATLSCDNNIFMKVGLEGNMWEYNVECYGAINDFIYCRWESTIPKVKFSAFGATYSVRNLITRGYNYENIQFTSDANCQISAFEDRRMHYNMSTLVAGTGITKDMITPLMRYTQGSAVDVSANPQIAPGTDGQVITIMGTSQTNTLTLNDTNVLDLSGTCVLGADDTLTLIYSSADGQWMEIGRSNNN